MKKIFIFIFCILLLFLNINISFANENNLEYYKNKLESNQSTKKYIKTVENLFNNLEKKLEKKSLDEKKEFYKNFGNKIINSSKKLKSKISLLYNSCKTNKCKDNYYNLNKDYDLLFNYLKAYSDNILEELNNNYNLGELNLDELLEVDNITNTNTTANTNTTTKNKEVDTSPTNVDYKKISGTNLYIGDFIEYEFWGEDSDGYIKKYYYKISIDGKVIFEGNGNKVKYQTTKGGRYLTEMFAVDNDGYWNSVGNYSNVYEKKVETTTTIIPEEKIKLSVNSSTLDVGKMNIDDIGIGYKNYKSFTDYGFNISGGGKGVNIANIKYKITDLNGISCSEFDEYFGLRVSGTIFNTINDDCTFGFSGESEALNNDNYYIGKTGIFKKEIGNGFSKELYNDISFNVTTIINSDLISFDYGYENKYINNIKSTSFISLNRIIITKSESNSIRDYSNNLIITKESGDLLTIGDEYTEIYKFSIKSTVNEKFYPGEVVIGIYKDNETNQGCIKSLDLYNGYYHKLGTSGYYTEDYGVLPDVCFYKFNSKRNLEISNSNETLLILKGTLTDDGNKSIIGEHTFFIGFNNNEIWNDQGDFELLVEDIDLKMPNSSTIRIEYNIE